MRYYENGYEKAEAKELYGAAEVKTKFLPLECRLYMIGTAENKRRAALYLQRGIAGCVCASDEFTLHFLCEQSCGVRIVKAEPRLMSA